jgi:Peptide N-acetyl-beta-D-glucosaminyl asparaginase amidase A
VRAWMGIVAAVLALPASASAKSLVNGPFPQKTGEMLTSVPSTHSCTVTVTQNYLFRNTAYGSDPPFRGTLTPPAGCPGPWAKVVMTMSAYVDNGVQFDRLGDVMLGDTELLHLTTPEGTDATNTWEVKRDVTQYAALLAGDQPIYFQLGNQTDSTYTGLFHGTLKFTYYETAPGTPAGEHADAVLSLPLRNLGSPRDRLAGSLVFPSNAVSLRAELFTSGHGGCEEDWWYDPFVCAGVPYREIAIYIDGRLGGVAPVYPALFTGGWGPDYWRPIPGPRTFNLRPYDLDLTPFVGTLTDGAPHRVEVGILDWTEHAGQGDYWPTAANLLVDRNPRDTGRTLGALMSASATPAPVDNVIADPLEASALLKTSHALRIAGWIEPAGGSRTTTTVTEHLSAANDVIGVVVKSHWKWHAASESATGSHTGITVSDSTYDFTRGAAHFTFADANRTTRSLDANTIFSSALDDRMRTVAPVLGITGLVGASQESWKYEDSTGICLDHELAAAAQNIVRDSLSRTCGTPILKTLWGRL